MLQPNKKTNRQHGEDESSLIFSGYRHKRRYLCHFRGRELWLPGVLYGALADLAFACLSSGTGVTEMSSVIAFRLRQSIKTSSGIPGDRFIASCGSSAYRLAIHKELIRVDETFFELEKVQLLPMNYFDAFESFGRSDKLRPQETMRSSVS